MGYANFGCDVGGYRAPDIPDKPVFVRWAQAMAFLPLLENGGGGEHRPWMYDDQTVQIYRNFANEHMKLAQFFLSNGANAADTNTSAITPMAPSPTRFVLNPSVELVAQGKGFPYPEPSTFAYLIGSEILVHPVVADPMENVTGVASVRLNFPAASTDDGLEYWLDWWEPSVKKKM